MNPAPKIIFLGTVGLNSPSRYPEIQKKLKNMVKIGYFGLRQNGLFLTKNGVSKKKSKKSPKNKRKKSSLDTISTEISGLSQLQPVFHLLTIWRRFFCIFFVPIPSPSHPHPTPYVFSRKTTKKRQKNCQKSETLFSIDSKHIFGSKLCPETTFFVYFLGFFLIFWKFGQNRLCCPKGQNSLFFTIFFNFFCILWYLEGEFRPTVPRYIILGAGFARGCPGNGLILKKMKTGQNSLRNSLRVGPHHGLVRGTTSRND